MKKTILIVIGVLLALLAPAQDIDSLFRVFENSRGEAAYQAALAIDEVIGRDPNFEADTDKDEIKLKVLRTMILYYFDNDDFQHVVKYSEVGIDHYRKIDDLFNLAGCYMTLANAYQRLGQLDKAIDCYNQCSGIMDEMGGEMAEVNKRYVMNNIAEIYLAMNEYDSAEELYRKCLAMLGDVAPDDTASNLDLATYYQNIAEVHIAQNKDDAVDYAEQSLELSQRYQDTPNKIINRLMSLSKAYVGIGKVEEGKRLLDQALQLAKDNNEVFLQAVILLQKGDYAQAIAMAEENHYDELLQKALEDAYRAERDVNPRLALEYYERSVMMKDSVFNETQQQLIRDYQVRYAMQEKEHELQMEQEKAKRNRMYVMVLTVIAALLLLIAVIWYRLAKVRKKRAEELAHLNETKSHLLSIVTHDVKTPVSAICQVLRGITDGYDTIADTDKKAHLMMLRSTSEALKDRMENIIHWVKQELESSVVTREEFNLHSMIEECIKTQETAIRVKSLKVVNSVPKDLKAFDDAGVVSLVLQNLLGNAVKFSYPDGEITIEAEKKNGSIWVAVADNGMGISEKKLEKIFNYMTTASKGVGGETGTGIGLFVSKQFIDKIGGEITIESGKGIGTTVKFSIHC